MSSLLSILAVGVFVSGAIASHRAGGLWQIVSQLDKDSPFLQKRKEEHQQYLHLSYAAFAIGFVILLANWLLG